MPSRRPGLPPLPPEVHCPTCGRPLDRLRKQPIAADLTLEWASMIYIERRLLGGLVMAHRRAGELHVEWGLVSAAETCLMRYRQVANAVRRLVPTGWVSRLARGRYRLTELAYERVGAMIKPGLTLKSLCAAQEPARGVPVQ